MPSVIEVNLGCIFLIFDFFILNPFFDILTEMSRKFKNYEKL